MNKWYWNETSDRETKNIICDHMKKTNTYYKVSEIGGNKTFGIYSLDKFFSVFK